MSEVITSILTDGSVRSAASVQDAFMQSGEFGGAWG
jgi:hypothetical protein